ncbi:MAG: ABC transporter permease [Dehalococcoidia bacterium]
MLRYLTRRLIVLVPTLLLVSLIIFGLMHILPGDVATMILMGPTGESGARPEDIAKITKELGLDRSLPVQYADWMLGVITLDAGDSLWSNEPIFREIGRRLPLTLELALLSTLVSLLVAIPTGIVAAVWARSWLDYSARVFAIAGLTLPNFWVGTLIILFLVYQFGWTPPLGYTGFFEDPWRNLQQLIWPALALGYYQAALVSRMTRSSLLEVLREDYVRTARAKGLREWAIIGRHALRNSLLPVVTLAAIQFGYTLGGTIVMETVFNLPGVGRYLVDAIAHRDYPVVQTLVLIFAVTFALINLLVDLLYTRLDPRIRYG